MSETVNRGAIGRSGSSPSTLTAAPRPGSLDPTTTPGPDLLRINGVTKRFGPIAAVDDVTLSIPRGAFATLLGPSGCGKTTLLRMIAGFYDPDAGEIHLDGRRIDEAPPHQRGTAMVFQDYALFPHMRVFDNVAYGLRLANLPASEIQRLARETLEFVGLEGLGKRWPGELSGGQQQRVALARALVVRPKALLLDEPLSNLDAKLRERMRWELRSLQQELGTTFIYVTHDQEEALAMSDWIAVLKGGRVEQWGTPWQIYNRPRTAFVADFVGQANLIRTEVLERCGETLVVSLGDSAISVAAPAGLGGSDVLLCVRPESVTLGAIGADPPAAPVASILGRVTRRAFLGHRVRYWVRAGEDEWIVDQLGSDAAQHQLTDSVRLSVPRERVYAVEF